MFVVYILYFEAHDKYYIGQINNIDNRLKQHNSGHSTLTKPYITWTIAITIDKTSRSEAMILEKKLMNLSKTRLASFIR